MLKMLVFLFMLLGHILIADAIKYCIAEIGIEVIDGGLDGAHCGAAVTSVPVVDTGVVTRVGAVLGGIYSLITGAISGAAKIATTPCK